MEIKNIRTNALRSYEKISSLSAKKTSETGKSVNTDKVDFDFASSLAAAKANAASSVDAQTNTDRIRQLQAQYTGETCPVASEAVAKAILGE